LAIADSVLTENYAIYLADCLEVLPTLPDNSVGLSVYSPPFANSAGGLYRYSSSERDLSNSRTYGEFLKHYRYVVREKLRVTMPGRLSYVHCMDVPSGNTGKDNLIDFPGAIIRLHERCGWKYEGRHMVWKEPLAVRNRTLMKSLAHMTVVKDSVYAGVASADQVLRFQKPGVNPVPVAHPVGLVEYAGEREIPRELLGWRGWKGKQTENRYSHWIWRQYASSIWDDIRMDAVLPFKQARDEEDEKHVHPLQLDVIHRCVVLGSNPGEAVLTPFMGVGSEVYEAVRLGRRGIGIELKPSYFRQSIKNLASVRPQTQPKDQSVIEWGHPESFSAT
jgi:DNA modification methylase